MAERQGIRTLGTLARSTVFEGRSKTGSYFWGKDIKKEKSEEDIEWQEILGGNGGYVGL